MARCARINQQEVWYALYAGTVEVTDAFGNYTGERIPTYATPISARMNVSPAKGYSEQAPYGIDVPYTKVVETDDMVTEFDATTMWWIGKTPSIGSANYRTVSVARGLRKSGTTKITVREVERHELQDQHQPT